MLKTNQSHQLTKFILRLLQMLTWQIRWSLRGSCLCKTIECQCRVPIALCTLVLVLSIEYWLCVRFPRAAVDILTS